MEHNKKQIDIRKTTLYKGMNATFGKIPVELMVDLDIQDTASLTGLDGGSHIVNGCQNAMKIRFSAGNGKMYRINEIGHFLEAYEEQYTFWFSKHFRFEPEKMYFQKQDRRFLEFLCNLKERRNYQWIRQQALADPELYESYVNEAPSGHFGSPKTVDINNEIIFDENECEGFLDFIWDDIKKIRWHCQAGKMKFEEDIHAKIKIEKDGTSNLMSIDYSRYGTFEPLTINFKYIFHKDQNLMVKLPEEKRAFMRDLYSFQNDENIICFTVGPNEKRLFQKNFLEKYGDSFGMFIDEQIKEEMAASRLRTKIYFDVSSEGIVSMAEFCYGEKVLNPLKDTDPDKSFRELEDEKKVLDQIKNYGFKQSGRLFLLNDVEKIMFLLTDKLAGLKKLAEVYYSADFKKLHVKNLDSFGLSLSEDDSMIHMNINLENVTDEELAELLDAIKSGKKYYRLRNGSIIDLSSVESDSFISFLNSLNIDKSAIRDGMFEIPLSRSLYIENYLKEKNVENVTVDSRLGYLMQKVSNPDDIELKLADGLKEVLRNYQLTGVKWLHNMAGYSFGGILADDMGLGKTLQVLAFISAEKQKRQLAETKEQDGRQLWQPCIVVAPASVIYNWKAEAEKFTPDLKVLVVTGSKDRRNLLIYELCGYDLVVTSYGVLKNDIESYQKIKFLYIFLDEAQNIKNPASLNANSVKSLTAKCAFALTGTPIENRLSELWSIFDFIMPGLLPVRSKFTTVYEEPIMRGKSQEKMDELFGIIRPFMIRRMKKDVLNELPEKIETNYVVEMTEEQKKLYAAFYKDFKNELLSDIEKSGAVKNQMAVFSALTKLRQICAHPGTFLEEYRGGSGKLDLAMEIIHTSVESGHSVLLFSQFTSMLKIIRNELEENRVNYYYLDGKMKPEERMMEIDNFNHDREAVFLISLKAGGTGLNLTKADVVIHFDPWWNPAVENQASDRAHRIGQKNVVQVYNLLTEGTIEEKIAKLKERKKDLAENLIRPDESFLGKLSEEEIRDLFAI